MNTSIAAIVLALVVPPALAGSSTGQVTSIIVNNSNVAMFVAGTHTGKPVCSVVGEAWAISLNTESGKAIFQILSDSQKIGAAVTVVGTNACAAWGDRESPAYVWRDGTGLNKG
jgi:hypothetical protein